jgi:hypothetical protein
MKATVFGNQNFEVCFRTQKSLVNKLAKKSIIITQIDAMFITFNKYGYTDLGNGNKIQMQ